uniref:Homeobox domain-containing protein n=1 Tax=Parascaris univalens TaxID=6257 RepID=A0A915BB59_PARUN
MKRSSMASVINSDREGRATVIEESELRNERIKKAALLHEALSQAGAVRAQKRKQKTMFSNEAVECRGDEHLHKECPAKQEFDEGAAENVVVSERSTKQLIKHKNYVSAIKEHFLFPLLELMQKKCEAATWSMSSEAFAMDDVVEMINEMSATNESMEFANSELDALLFNMILMLRIHLIELLKVADLCNDFKTKYTQSLKKKINQESMIGSGGDSDEDMGPSTAITEFPPQLSHNILTVPQGADRTIAMLATANGMVTIPLSVWDTTSFHPSTFCASTAEECCSSNCDKGPSTSDRTSSDAHAKSVIECSALQSYAARTFSDEDTIDARRKCLLPAKAVDTLKSWLFLHASHPYPSEEQKALLSKETGLQMVQINNWFINARRRILPSKLDACSNDEIDATVRQIGEWNRGTKRLRRESKSNNHVHHSVTNLFIADDTSPKVER